MANFETKDQKPKHDACFPNTTKHAVPRDLGPPKPAKAQHIRTGNSYGKRPAIKRSK